MNKFLEIMADWYRHGDNWRIVGFCAYVITSSLAKLYLVEQLYWSNVPCRNDSSWSYLHVLLGGRKPLAIRCFLQRQCLGVKAPPLFELSRIINAGVHIYCKTSQHILNPFWRFGC